MVLHSLIWSDIVVSILKFPYRMCGVLGLGTEWSKVEDSPIYVKTNFFVDVSGEISLSTATVHKEKHISARPRFCFRPSLLENGSVREF